MPANDRDTKATTSAASPQTIQAEAPPLGVLGTMRRALAGMRFARAEAHLTPPENRRPAAPPLPPAARQAAYAALRATGANPAWVNALQAALGVPEMGAVTLETVDAIAARQVAAGRKAKPGVLDAETLRELEGASPDLKKAPRQLAADGLEAARGGQVASAGKGAPEDEALRALGLATGYADCATRVLKTGAFLGQKITVHPERHARLGNALAYLRGRFVGSSDAQIGERLGIHTTSSFRASTATSDQMHHGSGFALDVNPGQNQWLFLGSKESALGYAMERAGVLFGSPAIQSGGEMWANAQKMDTEALFGLLQDSQDLFVRYRAMCHDRAAFEAYFASPECPPAAKARGLAYWRDKMPADERRLAPLLDGADGKPSPDVGFMDLKEATVMALRDAAGLRWGGADLGSDNGDLMHFDGHFMGTAQAIRGATLHVIQRRARSGRHPQEARRGMSALSVAPARPGLRATR